MHCRRGSDYSMGLTSCLLVTRVCLDELAARLHAHRTLFDHAKAVQGCPVGDGPSKHLTSRLKVRNNYSWYVYESSKLANEAT